MRRITSGSQEEGDAAWSPEGDSIVYVSDPVGAEQTGYRKDLWVVASDLESPPRRLTNNPRPKSFPAYAPGGKEIAYLSAMNGEFSVVHLAVVPAGGGTPRILTEKLDRWIVSFRYSHDGQWIYFNSHNAGAISLARVRVSDAHIETLIDSDRNVSAFDVAGGWPEAFDKHYYRQIADWFARYRN